MAKAQTGILRSWKEDRGFGFITPDGGGPDVFIHVSAFADTGKRPAVGEKLSYELGRGRDGRLQAVSVVRPGTKTVRPEGVRPRRSPSSRTNWPAMLAMIAVLGAGGMWGYKQFVRMQHRQDLAAQPAESFVPSSGAAVTEQFRCDGRTYCSQMTSCEEAKWVLNHCPGTKMDGNGDGIPCEQQWCK